jgi:serine/threonine-protein kinase
LEIADCVLDVLAAAHEKNIIHRDLKPANLFCTQAGELKVLDFGIAKLLEVSTDHTATGFRLLGTTSFMPPEQARARWADVGVRSDLWSLGATLFTLISGREVHLGAPDERLVAAMTAPAPEIRSIELGLREDVAQIIDRALEFEPARRWADAPSMQRAVRRALDRPDAVAPKTRRRMAPWLGAGALAIAVAAALSSLAHFSQPTTVAPPIASPVIADPAPQAPAAQVAEPGQNVAPSTIGEIAAPRQSAPTPALAAPMTVKKKAAKRPPRPSEKEMFDKFR